LTIHNQICHIFKNLNLAFAKSNLDSMQLQAESDLPLTLFYLRNSWRRHRHISLETFMEACVIYNALVNNKDKCSVRCEVYNIDIYSTEKDWLTELSKKVQATKFWEPETDSIKNYLEYNTNVQIVDNEVEWPYKVYFGSRVNPDFADYCDHNKSWIKIGAKAKQHIKNYGYSNGYYFYVKSEKQLMLTKIASGSKFGRVVKYVSRHELHK